NLSVQHSAGRNDSVEFTYLGSSTHRLPNPVDMGQCRPAANLFCDPGTRPWPRYGLMLYADSAGNSSYEAFIAKYEHRTSLGLNVRVEYTLGKALSDSWQASLTGSNQVTICRRCSKGPATFDVRQRGVASAVWELPFGHGTRWGGGVPRWADLAVGGWTVT